MITQGPVGTATAAAAEMSHEIELPPPPLPSRTAHLERAKGLLYRTPEGACATAYASRRAATFAHRPHDGYQPGDTMTLVPAHDEQPHQRAMVVVVVVYVNRALDLLVVECGPGQALCEEPPELAAPPGRGAGYLQLGLSTPNPGRPQAVLTQGHITCPSIGAHGHVTGPEWPCVADEGGGCLDVGAGGSLRLYGIHVGHARDPAVGVEEALALGVPATGTYPMLAERVHIVPACFLLPSMGPAMILPGVELC
jgi:hypothetical protein